MLLRILRLYLVEWQVSGQDDNISTIRHRLPIQRQRLLPIQRQRLPVKRKRLLSVQRHGNVILFDSADDDFIVYGQSQRVCHNVTACQRTRIDNYNFDIYDAERIDGNVYVTHTDHDTGTVYDARTVHDAAGNDNNL